mmetsp:Transcript_22243/g.46467  ORF Transcript_22243/g.46467 Transcript_22243/m.46467 type:complete len:240 (-) Transcript_22243:24-743(-)
MGPRRGRPRLRHGQVCRQGGVEDQPRGRSLLRPEDRHQGQRQHGPRPPVRHHPARLPAAHKVRPKVQVPGGGEEGGRGQGRLGPPQEEAGRRHRQGGLRAPRHGPPRYARLRGAHVRRPHRALRRQVAPLAQPPAGHDRPRPRRPVLVRRGDKVEAALPRLLRRVRHVQGDVPEEGAQRSGRPVELPDRHRQAGDGQRHGQHQDEGERAEGGGQGRGLFEDGRRGEGQLRERGGHLKNN